MVDDDGGPGVQFTDIARAVAAASDGDLILILAGDDTAFGVALERTLIGQSSAISVSGRASVVAAPGTVSLASMRVEGLDLIGCTQAVILDEVTISDELKLYTPTAISHVAVVEGCSDVRLIECSIAGRPGWQHHALRVTNSRVELVTSSVSGARGKVSLRRPVVRSRSTESHTSPHRWVGRTSKGPP